VPTICGPPPCATLYCLAIIVTFWTTNGHTDRSLFSCERSFGFQLFCAFLFLSSEMTNGQYLYCRVLKRPHIILCKKYKKPSCRQNSRPYWLWVILRSSKVDDFYFICKSVCHFLLVVNSNLGPISHCVWDMASFSLNFLPPSFNFEFENVPLAPNR